MSQHDFSIANQLSGPARADMNAALQALASQSSGATSPSTTYANQMWYDSANNLLKMRDEADAAWINIAYLDQTSGLMHLIADTEVATSAGVQEGSLGTFSESTWKAATETLYGMVAPDTLKAVVQHHESHKILELETLSSAVDYTTPTFPSTAKAILIRGSNWIPSVDGGLVRLRLSTDSGATYANTGYSYGLFSIRVSAIDDTEKAASASAIFLSGRTGSASGESGASFTALITNPAGSLKTHVLIHSIQENDSGNLRSHLGSAWYDTSSPVDGAQVYFSNGNVGSGNIETYEVK